MLDYETLSPYMHNLTSHSEKYQSDIEQLMENYQVQPVGNGYLDLIISRENTLAFIDELTRISVAVHFITWWCLCKTKNKATLGCPHGMGGPKNDFGDGWFSECVQFTDFDVEDRGINLDDQTTDSHKLVENCNRLVRTYIESELLSEIFFHQCLHPGLWLYVPSEWKRKYYLIEQLS